MDPAHGCWLESGPVGLPGGEEMAVDVVDVDGGDLGDGEVSEQWLEVTFDHAAGLAHRRRRPREGRGREPAVQQVGHRAGPHAGVPGFVDELGEAGGGVPLGAVHRLGRPPLPAAVRVNTEVDAQFPAVLATFA